MALSAGRALGARFDERSAQVDLQWTLFPTPSFHPHPHPFHPPHKELSALPVNRGCEVFAMKYWDRCGLFGDLSLSESLAVFHFVHVKKECRV